MTTKPPGLGPTIGTKKSKQPTGPLECCNDSPAGNTNDGHAARTGDGEEDGTTTEEEVSTESEEDGGQEGHTDGEERDAKQPCHLGHCANEQFDAVND